MTRNLFILILMLADLGSGFRVQGSGFKSLRLCVSAVVLLLALNVTAQAPAPVPVFTAVIPVSNRGETAQILWWSNNWSAVNYGQNGAVRFTNVATNFKGTVTVPAGAALETGVVLNDRTGGDWIFKPLGAPCVMQLTFTNELETSPDLINWMTNAADISNAPVLFFKNAKIQRLQ
jgi:hypothetical protein